MSLIERAALLLPGTSPDLFGADWAKAVDSRQGGNREGVQAQRRQPTLGEPMVISKEWLASQSLLVPGAPPSQLEGEFRIIKRPLILNATGAKTRQFPNARRIMVTSALPGEGKTFCAINLALTLAAERDLGVVLVDADVPRPSLHKKLGLPEGPGLMDALLDPDIDPVKLVHPTSIPNLAIMLAGVRDSRATELLASADMKGLVQALGTRFTNCLLVFDAPPLLATTESRAIASHVGQIVMVVERGRTSRLAVQSALEVLRPCEASVGLLLNKSPPRGRWATERNGSYSTDYGYG